MTVPTYHDPFDGKSLDLKKWIDGQILTHQMAFQGQLTITSKPGEILQETEEDGKIRKYHRAEIRQGDDRCPVHGAEIWQAFSFHVLTTEPAVGSLRCVTGQWKAPGDDSPFLANRYDNGVFHITTQDGPHRKVIAAAKGDPDRLHLWETRICQIADDESLGKEAVCAIPSSLRGRGAVDETNLLSQIKAKFDGGLGAGIEDLLDEFSFIEDIENYASPAAIIVDPGTHPVLPDPFSDWVRMTYRIRGGQPKSGYGPKEPGEITIWANGNLVATARGHIGPILTEPEDRDTCYVKLGIYRDVAKHDMRVAYRDFRQGKTQQEVSQSAIRTE